MKFRPEWVEKYHINTSVLSDCVEKWDYLYQAEKGSVYICRPWPAIAVWANETCMSSLPCETATTDFSFVKLNYCTSGRCEVCLENGKYVYLSAGMLSIDCNQPNEMFRYPTSQYEGLEIVLNLDELKKHPVVILEELGIGMDRQNELEKHNRGSYIAGVSPEWDVLAKSLIHLLKAGRGRIEDYRFYMVTLRKVLENLQNEENLSIGLLAEKQEDSPEAVQSALELLEQMGKVHRITMNLHCGHDCAGCASSCSQKAEEKNVRWELVRLEEKLK